MGRSDGASAPPPVVAARAEKGRAASWCGCRGERGVRGAPGVRRTIDESWLKGELGGERWCWWGAGRADIGRTIDEV